MEHTLGPFGGSPCPSPGARGGEIATFRDSSEASQVSKESQKVVMLPPLAWRGGRVSLQRVVGCVPGPFRDSPCPPGVRGGKIATFWDTFEAWEASEEFQKVAISPPLASRGGGWVSLQRVLGCVP